MKTCILKPSNWIYGFIISMLGFIPGCRQAEMYGTPSADFKISGRVTDVNNNPIRDIMVNVKGNSTQTDVSGNYILKYSSLPNKEIEITYKDIDGEENGGEFEEHKEVLELNDNDFVGKKDSWNRGRVEKTVNTYLKIKAKTEE